MSLRLKLLSTTGCFQCCSIVFASFAVIGNVGSINLCTLLKLLDLGMNIMASIKTVVSLNVKDGVP